jgi:hypothetical protein
VSVKVTFGLRDGNIPTAHRPTTMATVPAGASSLAVIWRIDTATKTQNPIVFRSRQGNRECEYLDIALRTFRKEYDLTNTFHFQFCSYDHFTQATGIAAPTSLKEMTPYRDWLLP